LDFFAKIICPVGSSDSHVCGVGSTALRAYLPESDIDVVLLHPPDAAVDSKQALFSVFRDIFAAIEMTSTSSYSNNPVPRNMTIRNVEFINARTSVVSCVVNNATVDVTINQIGAVGTTAFLEEASQIVGNDCLFKKSLILLKVGIEHLCILLSLLI
jgi:DNA polymerase sigma